MYAYIYVMHYIRYDEEKISVVSSLDARQTEKKEKNQQKKTR